MAETKPTTAELARLINEFHAAIMKGSAADIADELTRDFARDAFTHWVKQFANPPMTTPAWYPAQRPGNYYTGTPNVVPLTSINTAQE